MLMLLLLARGGGSTALVDRVWMRRLRASGCRLAFLGWLKVSCEMSHAGGCRDFSFSA